MSLPPPATTSSSTTLVAETFAPPLDRSRPLWELVPGRGHRGRPLRDRLQDPPRARRRHLGGRHRRPALRRRADDRAGAASRGALGAAGSRPRAAAWSATRCAASGRPFVRAGALAGGRRAPARAAPAKRASDGVVGLWEVTWNLAKPAPKVPLNVDIVAAAQLLRRPLRPRRVQSRSRTSSAPPSTTSPWRSPPAPCAAGCSTASWRPTGSSCRRWSRSRSAPKNEHGELGNQLTAMRGPLPVGIADPVERLRFVSKAMDDLKASKQPLGAEAIWGLNDWFRDFAPPLLLGADRGDQLLDPALQPARHQLPRARRSPSTCAAASWSRSTRSASSPAATRWRSRSSATTARSASACSADRDSMRRHRPHRRLHRGGRGGAPRRRRDSLRRQADGDQLAGDPRPRSRESANASPRLRTPSSAAASSAACARASPRAARR